MINETLLEQWQNTKIENDKLQQENKQLKEKVGELTQSLNEQMKETNKENLDCSKYAIENQQLKENNMSMQEEMVRTWKKADLYKDVIEEAREYIEKSSLEVNTKEFGNLTVCNSDDLLQILDKAKEVE